MNYEIIQSGSDGNATLIDGSILVDCGVPFKKLRPYEMDLKLVLLTHEHGDHFNPGTVKRIGKDRPTLRWAVCKWMVEHLLDAGIDKRNIDVMTPGVWMNYPNLGAVCPFSTPHNVPNCGWKIRLHTSAKRFLYATDLGCLPDGLTAPSYDFYLLEANHTEAEIEAAVSEAQENGEYSYRIQAAENHLSYEQALDWLTDQMGPQSIWVPMHEHKEKERTDDGRAENAFPEDHGP